MKVVDSGLIVITESWVEHAVTCYLQCTDVNKSSCGDGAWLLKKNGTVEFL